MRWAWNQDGFLAGLSSHEQGLKQPRAKIPSVLVAEPAKIVGTRLEPRASGNGPDAGVSAFFGRTKNDGIYRKTYPYLSKTAQCP